MTLDEAIVLLNAARERVRVTETAYQAAQVAENDARTCFWAANRALADTETVRSQAATASRQKG